MFLLALDLETTGLKAEYNEIVQIGAVLLDNKLNAVGTFSSLVSPQWPDRGLENGFNTYEYSGLNLIEVLESKSIGVVLDEMEHWIKATVKDMQKIVIFGQNPKFDYTFLEWEYKRLGRKFPFDFHVIGLDSLYAVFKFLETGSLPDKIRQKDAAKEFGVENKKAHDAVEDVLTAVSTLKKLCERMKVTNE